MPDSAIYLIGALTPILLGIAILVTLLVFPREREGEKADLVRLVLTIVGWAFIAIGTLIVLGVGMGLAPAVLAVIVGAMVFQRTRRASQRALLLTLAVAAERRIPLIPALEAFAADHRGAIGKRALLLARYLAAGWPLPDALARIGGLASPDALVLVRVGYESGALATALRNAAALGMSEGTFGAPLTRRIAGSGGLSEGSIWGGIAGRTAYLCFLLMFSIGVITFMMIKITPAFEKIFKDFNTQLPGVTRALISGSHATVEYWFLGGFLPPLLMFLLVYTGLRFIGVIRFDLLGLGWLTWRLDTAAVLDALALAASHERPLPETLSILGQHYPKRSIRWRIYGVLVDVQGGGDWVDSLRSRGLIGQAEHGVLNAASRVGNLPWALAEMADSARRRLAYRLQALLQVLFPLVILGFGSLVMFLVVGYFMPLIALITRLAG